MSKRAVIPIIIIAQFCCTSLWFAGNAVIAELGLANGIDGDQVVQWTIAVQLGFIIGTFVLAFFLIADRFSPSKVFLLAGLLGAFLNYGLLLPGQSVLSISILRFLTGFTLAGIYPIGMKIASDYRKDGLGVALGFLVGALVLGTAFPHLLKDVVKGYPWSWVIIAISILSTFGALMLFIFVGDGPMRQKQDAFNSEKFIEDFKNLKFKGAAFGYFGHMWELYTFWAFLPFIIGYYNQTHPEASLNVSFYSFAIIAVGAIACVASGYFAKQFGSAKTSFSFLLSSLLCCIATVFMFKFPIGLFLFFLFTWGFFIIGDSPQFSTLVAKHAKPENRGTSLTLVNCIGFSITIISLLLLQQLEQIIPANFIFIVLAIGPLLGLLSLRKAFFSDK